MNATDISLNADTLPMFGAQAGSSSPWLDNAGPSIGAILVDAGRLSPEDAEQIFRLQRTQGKRFGDAAVSLGLVSQEDIQFALSRQFDYPYLARGDHSLSDELVAAYQPFTPVVEQLRALRSQLMLRWFDAEAKRKSLALVSADHGEGRSFLAANLAIVFSQLGERTLLIDADMRRPRHHELFKIDNHHGLSNLLAGRTSSADVAIRIKGLLGLSVLPSGPTPPNPQELLGRPAFSKLLEVAGKNFDVILIDTPCAVDYADAQTIASRAGAAVVVARKHVSSAPLSLQLTRSLQQAGTAVLGSVMNDA